MQQSLSSVRECIAPAFDLEDAIANDELVLYYQPIVELRDGSIFAVEALVRWNHWRYGLLPPAAFLPQLRTAEEHRALDLWVLARAGDELSNIVDDRPRPFAVSINVGAQHLGAPDSIMEFVVAIQDGVLSPDRLIIELTESDALRDTQKAIVAINCLREIGVRFAIDDFGTGCATLDYLARLPADFLKIDRSFVRSCREEKPAAIIDAVLMLARRFGMQAILEGIEERYQLHFACTRRAAYAQGYLFARPLAIADLRLLLETPPGHWPPVR